MIFVSEIFCLLRKFYFIKTPVYIHRVYELETLGRKRGYIRAESLIKVICEILKFIRKKNNFLNKNLVKNSSFWKQFFRHFCLK